MSCSTLFTYPDVNSHYIFASTFHLSDDDMSLKHKREKTKILSFGVEFLVVLWCVNMK